MSNCLLLDPEAVMILPHDKGEPPSWGPRFAYLNAMVVWLYREEFNELQRRKNTRPCDICPPRIKEKCEYNKKPTYDVICEQRNDAIRKIDILESKLRSVERYLNLISSIIKLKVN